MVDMMVLQGRRVTVLCIICMQRGVRDGIRDGSLTSSTFAKQTKLHLFSLCIVVSSATL